MRSSLNALIKREISVVLRSQSEFIYPLAFFLIVTSLFPLAVTPDPVQLAFLAPGVIWVAALLSILMSLNSFYQLDYEEGGLEQLLLAGVSGRDIVMAKSIANWLVTGLPLVIVAPLIGVLFDINWDANKIAMLSLFLGTPSLCLIGSIGMCLTLGLRNGGVLLTLLVLPLFIPVLIFGASAVQAAAIGTNFSGQLAILGALLVLSIMLAPFAGAAAMKIAID
ncbi:MAG: heme exporter protein CcmB [Enterobacterales bacterium]|nr:heme exporter protein CcmB [Enterobacterales bacterium]